MASRQIELLKVWLKEKEITSPSHKHYEGKKLFLHEHTGGTSEHEHLHANLLGYLKKAFKPVRDLPRMPEGEIEGEEHPHFDPQGKVKFHKHGSDYFTVPDKQPHGHGLEYRTVKPIAMVLKEWIKKQNKIQIPTKTVRHVPKISHLFGQIYEKPGKKKDIEETKPMKVGLRDFVLNMEKQVGLATGVRTSFAPGPPPRPGLVWNPNTHRWISSVAPTPGKAARPMDMQQLLSNIENLPTEQLLAMYREVEKTLEETDNQDKYRQAKQIKERILTEIKRRKEAGLIKAQESDVYDFPPLWKKIIYEDESPAEKRNPPVPNIGYSLG